MTDKFYDPIYAYITEHGETGVNVLAKELDAPLSSLQRYLERQTYFKKTVNRKWDLPTNVDTDIKTNTVSLMVDSVENALLVLNAQLTEIQSSVQNALYPVKTLKRAVSTMVAPVAGNSTKVDKRLMDIEENGDKIHNVIKKQKDKIPDNYKDLLFNMDYIGLVLSMGESYVTELLSTDVYAILAGSGTELPEETIEVLKQHQKEA
jgi:hypothetical protein